MPSDIKIPSVGESITSGVIAAWHKSEGDDVVPGDVLLTLETDKVSTGLVAEAAGKLEVLVPAGEEVEIGAVVGRVIESAAAGDREPVAGGAARARGGEAGPAGEPQPEFPPAQAPVPTPAPPQLAVVPQEDGGGGQTATRSPGSGAREHEPAGEVEPGRTAAAPSPDSRGGADGGRTTRKRMSPLRKKIAAHLVDAQQTAAILTTFNECDMGAVMALRKDVQDRFVARHGVKLGLMSFFIKAVVQALKDVPELNARVDGDEIVTNHFYDIGVAIGTERGLIVPVVRDADRKSFAELEGEILDFAARARDNKITIPDLQGGVFTISNGGVYGSLLSTPILNPPQSGILGMHTIQDRPVASGGQVVVRPMMYLALSYDHRIVDGREAVSFLVRVKECIERPERMLVGA
jgi:2-oxoglutarate dehydrogenase E2 component (dihydrolipoamide succinyltransferase)